jgi:hypothetical protein
MSVSTLSETRVYGRQLEFTRERILPGIVEVAFDDAPLLAAFTGRLADMQFGPVRLNGRGKDTQGGESIRVQHNLGKNLTAKRLSGEWGTVTTDPSDTVRHSRANWKHYSATATISKTEELVNASPERIAGLVDFEMRNGVNSLVDLLGDDVYGNTGSSDMITALDDLISSNNTGGTASVQGITAATYGRWFSRGLSARGTATGSVSYTSGSFTAQGLSDMRRLWMNCNATPQALYCPHIVFEYYEGSLQAQERFTSTTIGDAGFMNLAFKSAPVFADSKATSGTMWAINFDNLNLVFLAGADFTSLPFHEAENQEAVVSKILAKCNMVVKNRLALNKMTGITA